MRGLTVLLGLTCFATGVASQASWCGKNFRPGQPVMQPGGQFPIPAATNSPLLSFRCTPAIRPYLPSDVSSSSQWSAKSILIDTPVRFSQIPGVSPITFQGGDQLSVTVSLNGTNIASGSVPLNATNHALSFNLGSLSPNTQPHTLTCTATLGNQTFNTTSALTFLPEAPSSIGSVTKMDLRTGAMLAKQGGTDYEPVFPIGFYTQYAYLAQNLSVINELKAQGFTVIHPIPPFDNTTLDSVLSRMEQVGIYLMYDMRNTYMNLPSVSKQVNSIKSRRNLLLWYTADEPDGPSDPLNATSIAYDLIASVDGGGSTSVESQGVGYHPTSLVLNCQDHDWTSYTRGTDVVMQDAYMISNNMTYSTVYGTVCNGTYGCCGCDNCKGQFEDISTRMDEFRQRLFINGWDRTKTIWTVPQGFGNDTFWPRFPTGKEFIVQSILGINHGATGVVSWDDPTSADIKSSASSFALSLPQITPFMFSPTATFRQVTTSSRIDVGLWTDGSKALVLATNMNYATSKLAFSDLGLQQVGTPQQVFASGANVSGSQFNFESVGSGAWILMNTTSGTQSKSSSSSRSYKPVSLAWMTRLSSLGQIHWDELLSTCLVLAGGLLVL